jgi:hypothetical protein
MSTILILNAVSSLVAAAGMTGALAWKRRLARRRAALALAYVRDAR